MAGFLTRDPTFLGLLETARRAARSNANVLVTGETGTGKGRMAAFLHENSPRAAGPFVEVHCANLAPELIESELFGHEKGAFTDAHETRRGRFELADGGTMFLDEVQDLPIAVQPKVLRVVQEKRFERVGGHSTLALDLRIVASLRDNPERLIEVGALREDLYYRLNVVRLHLPPLRDRRADVLALAESFLDEASQRHAVPRRILSERARRRLEEYDWPGNVRELQHAVTSAALLGAGETIEPEDLPHQLSSASPSLLRTRAQSGWTLREVEDAYIDEVLRRTRGNKSAAARILGIHRKTLHEKIAARRDGDPEA